MTSLQTRVSQSIPYDTVESTYLQTLDNHRRSLLRASSYRSSEDTKKNRLTKELETYDDMLNNISGHTSHNHETDLEQKIELYMHDMPALDHFSFPAKKQIRCTTDFSLLMPSIKKIEGFFIETYAQNNLDKKTYHSLRDLHRLTMDYLLFSYDTAQQNIGMHTIQAHLENTANQLQALLAPLLHNPDRFTKQVQATDITTVENTKELLAESYFLKVTNNPSVYKRKLVQKDSLIDTIDDMNQRYHVDLTTFDGSLSPLEKISRKVEDKEIQQTIFSLIQNITQRHRYEEQSYETPSFKEEAYQTITHSMLTDINAQLSEQIFSEEKQEVLEQFKNAISAAIHSDDFKSVIYHEIDNAINNSGSLDSIKKLIYGFHSVEERTNDYLFFNPLSKGLYAKLQTFQRNLTRTIQEKDTKSAIDFLKRMEVTVEKAPSKFGSEDSIVRSFISLFSKEAAHYFKLPDYSKSSQPISEQFATERTTMSKGFSTQLDKKDEQYHKHSSSHDFQKRYTQISDLEHALQRRVSGEFIRDELLMVEPVFRSQDYMEYTEKIRDYMISLFMHHEPLRKAAQNDEEFLTQAKQTLHTIYLQMYKLNTQDEFDSFFENFSSLIQKGSTKDPDPEYVQSTLLLTSLYMKTEGMDLSNENFTYFFYRQAKQCWEYLGNEEKTKVDSYFARRDAQRYQDTIYEQNAA